MQNKTIATWITVSTIVTWGAALLQLSSELIGLGMLTLTVFACIGAYRLNKL